MATETRQPSRHRAASLRWQLLASLVAATALGIAIGRVVPSQPSGHVPLLAVLAVPVVALFVRVQRHVIGPLRDLETEVRRSAQAAVPDPVAATGPREIERLATEFNNLIEARRDVEKQLAHQALHDELTGLPNRTLLIDRLSHALAQTARSARYVGVLFLDIDRFKVINDGLGHAAGDDVLVEVADRLSGMLRRGDTVARLGGDEFVVLCESLLTEEQAETIAERLMEGLRPPILTDAGSVVLSVSIGIATGIHGKHEPSGLLSDANAAMYVAKDGGRARFEISTTGLRAIAAERLELETDLRQAEERGELRLAFQPIVDMATESVRAVEALLRWDHPERGEVPPAFFIPLAEDTGIIDEIGDFVLSEACVEARRWRDAGFPTPVSVNVSPRQLTSRDFPGRVQATLDGTGLDPSLLVLEVTESAIVNNAGPATRVLRELKSLGVSLSIDDFGTGYSSLSYLRQLPVDELKIDRSFVTDIGKRARERAVVAAIVDMAKALGLRVVAEGVETRTQATMLKKMGCHKAQGFLFARPQRSDSVMQLFARAARPAPRRRSRAATPVPAATAS